MKLTEVLDKMPNSKKGDKKLAERGEQFSNNFIFIIIGFCLSIITPFIIYLVKILISTNNIIILIIAIIVLATIITMATRHVLKNKKMLNEKLLFEKELKSIKTNIRNPQRQVIDCELAMLGDSVEVSNLPH